MRKLFTLLLISLLFSGCPSGGGGTQDHGSHDGHDHASHEGHDHASHDATPAPTSTPMEMADAPEGAKVSFKMLKDGDKVSSPVAVAMMVEGMEVKPAGDTTPASGHHHIIVDGQPVPKGEAVPSDEKHIHFGQGQTETEVELPPGEHTLTLQFADFAHRSYGPDLSATVKITVEE